MPVVRRRGGELVAAVAVGLLGVAVAYAAVAVGGLGLGFGGSAADWATWMLLALGLAYAAAPIVTLLRVPGWRGVGAGLGAVVAGAILYFGLCLVVLEVA